MMRITPTPGRRTKETIDLRSIVRYIVEFVPPIGTGGGEKDDVYDSPANVFRRLFMPVVTYQRAGGGMELYYAFSYGSDVEGLRLLTTPVAMWANAHHPGFMEATVYSAADKQDKLNYLDLFHIVHLPNHPDVWRALGLDPSRTPPTFSEMQMPVIDILLPRSTSARTCILQGHTSARDAAIAWSNAHPGSWDVIYMLFLLHYRHAICHHH